MNIKYSCFMVPIIVVSTLGMPGVWVSAGNPEDQCEWNNEIKELPREKRRAISLIFDCFYKAVPEKLGPALAQDFQNLLPSVNEICAYDHMTGPSIWLIEKLGGEYGALREDNVKTACQSWASEYTKEFKEADEKRQERRKTERAVIGTNSWVSNFISGHTNGHYDLSKVAMKKLLTHDGLVVSMHAIELVSLAAADVDDAMWKAEQYHAHTPVFEIAANGIDSEDRNDKIKTGKNKFENAVCRHTTSVLTALSSQNPEFEKALYNLGVLFHMLQDLTYHHGMTLRQHSGLQFISSKNPDVIIDESERRETEESAVELSYQVAKFLISLIDKNPKIKDLRSEFLNWKPFVNSGPAFDVAEEKLNEAVYGAFSETEIDDNEMTIFNLFFGYMMEHNNIKFPRYELDDAGIVYWSQDLNANKTFINEILERCARNLSFVVRG